MASGLSQRIMCANIVKTISRLARYVRNALTPTEKLLDKNIDRIEDKIEDMVCEQRRLSSSIASNELKMKILTRKMHEKPDKRSFLEIRRRECAQNLHFLQQQCSDINKSIRALRHELNSNIKARNTMDFATTRQETSDINESVRDSLMESVNDINTVKDTATKSEISVIHDEFTDQIEQSITDVSRDDEKETDEMIARYDAMYADSQPREKRENRQLEPPLSLSDYSFGSSSSSSSAGQDAWSDFPLPPTLR